MKQVRVDEIFQEKYTGTTTKRPEFARLLAIVQPNDVIIVTKLDRFARNTGEDLQMIQQLFENQVKINILNMGTIDDTPVGRLIFTVFSAFAQFERDMIVTRTQEGKSYARRHNPKYHEGRPKVYSDEKNLAGLSASSKRNDLPRTFTAHWNQYFDFATTLYSDKVG